MDKEHKNAASERVHQGKHRLIGTCKCNTAVGVPVPGGQANQTTRSLNHATCKNHSVAASGAEHRRCHPLRRPGKLDRFVCTGFRRARSGDKLVMCDCSGSDKKIPYRKSI